MTNRKLNSGKVNIEATISGIRARATLYEIDMEIRSLFISEG